MCGAPLDIHKAVGKKITCEYCNGVNIVPASIAKAIDAKAKALRLADQTAQEVERTRLVAERARKRRPIYLLILAVIIVSSVMFVRVRTMNIQNLTQSSHLAKLIVNDTPRADMDVRGLRRNGDRIAANYRSDTIFGFNSNFFGIGFHYGADTGRSSNNPFDSPEPVRTITMGAVTMFDDIQLRSHTQVKRDFEIRYGSEARYNFEILDGIGGNGVRFELKEGAVSVQITRPTHNTHWSVRVDRID